MLAPSPWPHRDPHTDGLASFFEMIRFKGDALIAICQFFTLNSGARDTYQANGSWDEVKSHFVATEELNSVSQATEVIAAYMEKFGCPQTLKSLKRFAKQTKADMTVESYLHGFDEVFSRFRDEMEDGYTFHTTAEVAKQWGRDDHLSEAARARFAPSAQELRSSGSAYAAGLYSASVFHAMRAAEAGLRVVAEELGVTPADTDGMKDIIRSIRTKAAAIDEERKANNPTKSFRSQHYSEIAIEASLFKDAWRNHVAHAKIAYDQEQAFEILQATKRFFEKIVAGDVPSSD